MSQPWLSEARLRWNLVDLGRHDEVTLAQPVDSVRPESDLCLSPRQQDVRMMPLLFGQCTHSIHKVERLLKVGKSKGSGDVVLVDHFPVRKLMAEIVKFLAFERGSPSPTRNAGLFGELSHEGHLRVRSY